MGHKLGWRGGTLEFDLKQFSLQSQLHWADVVLAGAGLTLVIDAHPSEPGTGTVFGNPGLEWTHYRIPLAPGAGWKLNHQDFGADATSGQIAEVLEDLIVLRIRGEFVGGFDRAGLDNVRLVPPRR